jgi:biopolymer transport protein TolR
MAKIKRHRQFAEINVVPYIDVMLVLLVIFMVTSPLLFQEIDVNLPVASIKSINRKSQKPIILSIDAQGKYYLNISSHPIQTVSAAELSNQVANELKRSQSQGEGIRQILIKGDKNINYSKVIQAMTLLQHAGALKIGLATQLD